MNAKNESSLYCGSTEPVLVWPNEASKSPAPLRRGQDSEATNETESGETCSTTVTGMRSRWSGWSRIWKAWPELLHDAGRLGLNKPDGYLLGSYRIATAPEPNSSRLTSLKS